MRAFLMAAVAMFGVGASAHAAAVLDQSYLVTDGYGASFSNGTGFRHAETVMSP